MSEMREGPTEAGPEMDALVAEKVMGWRLERTGGDGKYRDAMRWIAADGGIVFNADWHWRPSIDIDDAWLVAEKMRKAGRYFSVDVSNDRKAWLARVDHDEDSAGTTAPLAICLAALAAVSRLEEPK